MSTPSNWVHRFDAAGVVPHETLGGKCEKLAKMTQQGLPVPPGFGLTTEIFKAFIESAGLRQPIIEALTLPPEHAAEKASALILNAAVPANMQQLIAAEYRRLSSSGDESHRVAVRSSALSEDTGGSSGAGQQLTVLGVRSASDVVNAVRECWASLFSDHAIRYRQTRGLTDEEIPLIAVGVQILVDARAAGVLFTRDPITGDDSRLVVEATYGLGESLVSGHVTPDRYVLQRETGRTLDQSIGSKESELVMGDGGVTETRDVSETRRSLPCLSHADRTKLHALALKAEEVFGPGQDIEWAVDHADGAYLLQARPITAHGQAPVVAPAAPKSSAAAGLYSRWLTGGK